MAERTWYDFHPIYYRFPQDQPIIEGIAKAIDGEYAAISCYEKLARLAPGPDQRDRIREIRQDEIRHYRTFSQLFYRLTGRQHTPQPGEACPDAYGAGIDFAFRDEQETADRYLEISDRTNDPPVKEAFRRASADEQNHAVWFLYWLSRRRE